MLREGLDGRFGGVVRGVAGGVGDALFGSRDDYGGWGRRGGRRRRRRRGDEREEGVEAVDDAEEVHVHDLVEVGAVGPVALEADPGVEDEEVDFGGGGEDGLGRLGRCVSVVILGKEMENLVLEMGIG